MRQIGDYLVRRLVGEGGMGRVFEAEERLSKRRVALKVLRKELAQSEAGRRLFLNEMRILALLEHPNVVRSLSSIETDGELVMVLEYLDGKTLRDVLAEKGRLPWARAASVAARVASALSAAHGQRPPIVHRDLKPENIMVLEGGGIKVMDFGIAKALEQIGTNHTQSVGTLQYMSPEQIDARQVDHRADLYGLGLVLYEMLAGRPPFESTSPRKLLDLQCTAEPPPFAEEVRAEMPEALERLVFELLEKAPEDRPYLAEDVLERLESLGTPGAPERGAETRGNASPAVATRGAKGAAEREASPTPPAPPTPPTKAGEPAKGGRADTIALLEQATSKDVPARKAVAIAVALSIAAGIGAYLVRRASPAPGAEGAGAPGATRHGAAEERH